ncbi:MAG: metal-dependent phosphohydrolase, partial [Chloroflexi bacterium HGW-Chloroflexi-8]
LSETIGVDDFLPPSENIQKASQPFYAAPGSGYMSHHAYPGGLATHTAFNIRSSLNVSQGYFETFHCSFDTTDTIPGSHIQRIH